MATTRKAPSPPAKAPAPGPAPAPAPAGFRLLSLSPNATRWLQIAVLFALPILSYIPVMSGGFIWDDNHMVYSNPLVQAGAREGLGGFWFTRKNFDYFPLTSTSLWLEWRLWGPNAPGYHVTNILLHAMNALLLWRVLLRLGIPAAWLGALIFGVHPVTVASVAWIAERKNTLCMLFNLLAVLGFLRWREGGRRAWSWYVASLLAFAAALFSKTAVVVTPFALGLIDWWKRGKLDRRIFRAVAPYILMSIVMGSMTILFQYSKAIGPGIVRPESMLSRILGVGWCLWFYLYKALVPLNLMMVYPRWNIAPADIMAWMPLPLYVVTLLALWFVGRRRPWARVAFFAIAIHGVMLLPVLGWFKIYYMRFALAADHWHYFAFMAPVLLITGGIAAWARTRPAAVRTSLAVAAAALVAFLAVRTWIQAGYYRNEANLWIHNIARNPSGWVAYNNLAMLQPEGSDEAVRLFNKAIALNPDYHEAYFGLGQTLRKRGDVKGALESLHQAVGLRPNFFFAQNVLGLTYLKTGDPVRAAAHFRVAVATRDEFAEAWSNLGVALYMANDRAAANSAFQKAQGRGFPGSRSLATLGQTLTMNGRLAEAEAFFRQALQQARDPLALVGLAQNLARQGRKAEALLLYQEALQLVPGAADVRYAYGLLLMDVNRPGEAQLEFQALAGANPDFAMVRFNLGCALHAVKRSDEAVTAFQEALKIAPNLAEAANGIGVVLGEQGRHRDAITWFERALAANPNFMQSWVNKANMINLSGRPADSVREYAAAAAACEQKGMLGDAVNILQTALTVATNAPGSTDVAQLEQTLRLYRDKLAEATALGATNAVPRKP